MTQDALLADLVKQFPQASLRDLERLNQFRDVAFDVLRHRTRITQVRGLLFSTFRCEAYRDGAWRRVYQNPYLR